ncbi:DNA-binding response regulator, OmpR family, contains REC and winged-helix (wHTH) domain [Actinopolyspora mzabensis]|uniref:DNA-binding response regulator, OmpR family, contains REC and winged-helix (WHTH) domain n=1 Tax=Actinopolyspora mzabensis TaxID=995066 RepID=A0A1G8VVH5_ACTMZ|nr:response regulator transcription factor [Actinopolyspora mzabensis]SDJ69969.1 DNA-binding response regulator, OmpR family, contains REC and winged-helix (wHTH) domain [Actinopolyspora mzabensis]
MLRVVNHENTPVRVLVVDDEAGVRTALRRGLSAEGMEVTVCSEGHEALRQGATGSFDVILLDVLLPGLSGYRVLERLRHRGIHTPVLLVSAKDGEFDQADGLDLGADGYVVKPFSFVVLAAQVRALVRRGDTPARQDSLRVGELEIDRSGRKVSWAGDPIALSPREYKLLVALASRPGTVLTKEDLLQAVWGNDQEVTRNVVEVYVGYLRRKLDAVGAGELVETVRGHGYRMNDA